MEEPKSIVRNRQRREIQKHARFDDMIAYDFPLIDGVPNNYKDVIQSPDRLHWQKAMNQEITKGYESGDSIIVDKSNLGFGTTSKR